jgi:AraC-like DNA-binding protein
MHEQRARIAHGQTDAGHWEFAGRPPRRDLEPYVKRYYGYVEATATPLRRREFPSPNVVVILELGPPIRVLPNGNTDGWARHRGGFAAGISDSFTITEHDGVQRGLEVMLTPVGAALLFRVAMTELRGRVVDLRDILPPRHRDLNERLEALPSWDARFDLVERVVAERVEVAGTRTATVVHALRWIEEHGGTADVGALAGKLGYSQKHVIHLFRELVGVPPKQLARIVRFDRLIDHLRRGGTGTWADLALEFGYYDQSHLVRDVRQFTGVAPTDARGMLSVFGDGTI